MSTSTIAVHAPARSHSQRMAALRLANGIRSYRKELKEDLRSRRTSPADVLERPEPQAETMKVVTLLMASPSVGPVKANKLLRCVNVSSSKTVGGLSPRQRTELIALLPRACVHPATHSSPSGT